MEGLSSFLLFAGLFYFMMRFGCGAHAVHGRGGGGHGLDTGQGVHERTSSGRATDPVCGIAVAPNQGYAMLRDGNEYRFCSRACLDEFEANPDQYVSDYGGVQ